MKTFEGLFAELQAKAKAGDPASGTVKELEKGTHFIGKKVIEEAGDVWIAAEHEGKERTAEEMAADVQENAQEDQEEQVKPTHEERIADLEEALEMLLSGVTE